MVLEDSRRESSVVVPFPGQPVLRNPIEKPGFVDLVSGKFQSVYFFFRRLACQDFSLLRIHVSRITKPTEIC